MMEAAALGPSSNDFEQMTTLLRQRLRPTPALTSPSGCVFISDCLVPRTSCERTFLRMIKLPASSWTRQFTKGSYAPSSALFKKSPHPTHFYGGSSNELSRKKSA